MVCVNFSSNTPPRIVAFQLHSALYKKTVLVVIFNQVVALGL